MATIYKKPNSPFWYAQYFDAEGQRVSRSTKQKLKRVAEREAARFESEEREGRTKNAHLPKAFLTVVEVAAREAASGALTLTRARELVDRLHRLANPSFKVVSLERCFGEWLARQEGHITETTAANYRNAIEAFKVAMGPKTMAAPVGQLTEEQVSTAIERMRVKTVLRAGSQRKVRRKAATVNLFLAVIRSALTTAVSRGLATANVAKGVRTLAADDTTERAPFDAREVRLLIDTAATYKPFVAKGIADEWAGAVTIAAHTGLRCNDVLSLGRGNIEGDKIVIRPKKTAKRKTTVVVPMTPAVAGWIGVREGAFFPRLSPQLGGTVAEQFKALMRAAGVERAVTLPGGVNAVRSFHSLRHTFVSWLAENDVHADIRRKLAGHTTEQHHETYTHVDESLKRAVGALPKL